MEKFKIIVISVFIIFNYSCKNSNAEFDSNTVIEINTNRYPLTKEEVKKLKVIQALDMENT